MCFHFSTPGVELLGLMTSVCLTLQAAVKLLAKEAAPLCIPATVREGARCQGWGWVGERGTSGRV